MSTINTFFAKIPVWLSGRFSIFIYLFLFFYLVLFALLCNVIPAWKEFAPSDMVQLILRNYTNVLSALGASIAAGSGVVIHRNIKLIHQRHEQLEKSINELHEKLEKSKETK